MRLATGTSLRAKLTLTLALLSAASTVLIGWLAYVATANQLAGATDRSLAEVAAYLSTQHGPNDGRGGPDGINPQSQGVLVQQLASNGSVAQSPAGLTVPVDGGDRAIASGATPDSSYRDVTVDGVQYRMLTTRADHGGAVQLLRSLREQRNVLQGLKIRIALAAVAVVTVALLAGWLLSRRLTGRLTVLAAAARTVANTGRLDVPIDPGADDETGQVATAIRHMLSSLDRVQAAQRQLVQDAGHELRTPLTSLRTNLDVLHRHRELSAAERGQIIDALRSETRELTSLLNEVIALGSGAVNPVSARPVELAEVARRAVGRAHRRSGREIVLHCDASVVLAVPADLERAMSNLLDNAIKFSPAGSPVELEIADGRVLVRDHGAGLAAADMARIFDRFYRADGARTLPGSGLGLSIVEDIARRNGGTVQAGNHPEGGAQIGFNLPARYSNLPLAQPMPGPRTAEPE